MKNKKLIGFGFVALLFFLTFSMTSVVASDNNDYYYFPYTDTTIWDAYYTNLDNGQVADDIVVDFSMYASSWNRIEASILYIELSLPSGYTYNYRITFYKQASSVSTLLFYNHATEPGWYSISIVWYALIRDTNYAMCSWDYLEFDPPGGSPGTEPIPILIL